MTAAATAKRAKSGSSLGDGAPEPLWKSSAGGLGGIGRLGSARPSRFGSMHAN
jgi:hypothetical protein